MIRIIAEDVDGNIVLDEPHYSFSSSGILKAQRNGQLITLFAIENDTNDEIDLLALPMPKKIYYYHEQDKVKRGLEVTSLIRTDTSVSPASDALTDLIEYQGTRFKEENAEDPVQTTDDTTDTTDDTTV